MNEAPKKYIEKKPRIAIYYPCFMGGGAEAVVLWMLEALKDTYELTLFTFSDLDLNRLNLMYGTHLSKDLVKLESLSPNILTNCLNFLFSNNNSFRQFVFHSLLRRFKHKVSEYDLAISAYNAVDLGVKGIQYVHWVKVIEGGKAAKSIYLKLSDFSLDKLKENITIANSSIVADTVEKTYGIKATVIYPPVIINVSEVPWEQKENAFICSGRLVKAKNPHGAIRILKAVREKGFDLKLYLTGGGGGVSEWQYKRFLEKMVQENNTWVELCENLSYQDYTKLLEKCKYGIHLKQEPFGISVAEMLKAGAIPFVRNEGGQVEIVGQENEEILFENDTEAIEKIVRILSDSSKQKRILESLEDQKTLFSTETFMKEISQRVKDYLEAPIP